MAALARLGRLFPRNDAVDIAVTTMRFPSPPEAVWRSMMFYEEVPRRPMPLLRLFLPLPVRTEGDKTQAGSLIQCTYDGGYLEKTIETVTAPSSITFDVRLQQLGIEDSILMTGGSYTLAAVDAGTELTLTTRYHGNLRPRWLWRPFERFLAHRVHRHILLGMRHALEENAGVAERVLAKT